MKNSDHLTTQTERAALLEAVKDAQIAYWDACRELEEAYSPDAEIDHADFDGITVEELDAEMEEAGTNERAVNILAPGE